MACGCWVTCRRPSVVGRPSVHHDNIIISQGFLLFFFWGGVVFLCLFVCLFVCVCFCFWFVCFLGGGCFVGQHDDMMNTVKGITIIATVICISVIII